jgi:hypothetical protein
MIRLDIAGIHTEIISDNIHMFDKYKPFIRSFQGKAHITVSLKGCGNIRRPQGKLLLTAENVEWLANNDNDIFVCAASRYTGEPLCLLHTDNGWSTIDISYIKDYPRIEYAVTGIMFNIIIRSRVIFHQGIVIHASAIKYDGKGIIFSAPSGTGKSTQAGLWEEYMGARVLNDDCPVVKIEYGRPYIYGTPCSGSTDKFLNDSVPLSAIVIIEQAGENTIRALTNREAISYLMPRCFLSYYDQNLMDMAAGHLERIISTVPIYLLRCRPDREAVELVHRCIG